MRNLSINKEDEMLSRIVVAVIAIEGSCDEIARCTTSIICDGITFVRNMSCTSAAARACCAIGMYNAGETSAAGDA